MSTHPWDSVSVRWGDGVYRIALLLSGTPEQAQQATSNAFALALAQSSTCDEDALLAALLAQPRRRLRPWARNRLPRPLPRIAGDARALLGLWLLQGMSGQRLLNVANLPAETLVARLADALQKLAAGDGELQDSAARACFSMWLTRRLGLTDGAAAKPLVRDADERCWEAVLERAAEVLRRAVGRQRLPVACMLAIDEHIRAAREPAARSRWQRGGGLALLAGCVGLLGLLLLMAPSAAHFRTPASQSVAPREIVQRALDGWLAHPASGARQREVWAIHPDAAFGPEALITKLWLDGSSDRHRFEVWRGNKLVEWQIGDGDQSVSYAADPFWTACPWGVDQPGGMLAGDLRTFVTTPSQQQAQLHARLTSGAYGFGYVVLSRALAASDLRSLGTRVEGGKALLVLRFTDRSAGENRSLLLTLDTTANELQGVREVQSVGGQQAARDLWRVLSDEPLEQPISLAPLPWSGPRLDQAQLLDPVCPALLPEYLVSLRDVVANPWWSSTVWLPTKPPTGVTGVALVHPHDELRGGQSVQNTRVVLAGADRWLSITTSSRPVSSASSGVVRGRWRWLREENRRTFSATICLNPHRSAQCYSPQIDIVARGWPQAELMALLDTLAPASVQTWGRLGDLLIEPKPLAPDVHAVLMRAVRAQAVPLDGMFQSVVERENRVNPVRLRWADPYHLPLDVLAPAHVIQSQWLEYEAGRPVRYKQLQTASNGKLLAAEMSDAVVQQSYRASTGKLFVENVQRRGSIGIAPQPLADQLLTSLFTATEPISLTEQTTTWMLEQRVSQWKDPLAAPNSGPTEPWHNDVKQGNLVQRVYLDKARYRLLSIAISLSDASGQETLLSSTRLRPSLGEASKPPGYELPELPRDTLTITNNFAAEPLKISAAQLDLRLPTRALRLPETEDAIVEADRNPWAHNPAALGQPVDSQMLLPQLYQPLYAFDNTLLHVTRYRLPALNASITIRQGPRDLLQHVLRYQSRAMLGETLTWDASRPVAVTIAGQQRAGWLITHQFQTVLVVEVDDVLLYITSEPGIDLAGPFLTQLAALEWVDLSQ